MPKLLNVGSLNVDLVYCVPHIVRPGQTLAALGRERFAGGKGLNQSIAAARAGLRTLHLGRIGRDGLWLRDALAEAGVDVGHVAVDDEHPTGHALIQVSAGGENAILVDAGANGRLDPAAVAAVLADAAEPGDWALFQNETNGVAQLLAAAADAGLKIAFNPAPMTAAAAEYPLDRVDLLVVNETEAEALSGEADPRRAAALLPAKVRGEVVVTAGAAGAFVCAGGRVQHVPALAAQVVDTTAAGDTFIGYLLAGLAEGMSLADAAGLGCAAAAIGVGRAGASPSVPARTEVDAARAARAAQAGAAAGR